MRFIKSFFAVLLCTVICFSFITTVSAATNTPRITVSNITAAAGDTVVINVEITDNPGIMAMAFCVTYDSDALAFKNYSKGYLTSYTIMDHSDKGHISFVNVESKDVATNGTIISLLFEVKKDAKPGKHIVTLANSNREKYGTKLHNSFSNSKQEFVIPKVISGSVTIPETCENSGHNWGEWNVISEANCTETGIKSHSCIRCEIVEEVTVPITHDFEAEWTIDKAATPEEDGIMSRHCTKCDEVTDKVTFSYEEIGGDEEDDTSSDDISGDTSSDNTSSDDNSSNESSSNESDTEDNNSSNTSDDATAEQKPNQKPNIDNIIGEKVPLEEVEKLEDYQQNIKPGPENNDTSNDDTSNQETPSEDASNSSDIATNATDNSSSKDEKNDTSFWKTTTGIIIIALCSLLGAGIIILTVLLVIRNKKSDK